MGTDNHFKKYRNLAGDVVSRVTTILGNIGWKTPMLLGWQYKMWGEGKDPNTVRDRAAMAGTLAHEMVEMDIRRELGLPAEDPDLFEYDEEIVEWALNAYGQYQEFRAAQPPDFKWESTEAKLVSEWYQCGGTCDGMATVGGKRVLIDFKTSRAMQEDHIIQVAAYKNMFEEQFDLKVDYCMILRIDREEPVYEAHIIPDDVLKTASLCFDDALSLHSKRKVISKYLRGLAKKKKKVNEDE